MGCQKWSDLVKSGPPSRPIVVSLFQVHVIATNLGLNMCACMHVVTPLFTITLVYTCDYTAHAQKELIAHSSTLMIQNDSVMQASLTVTTVPL